MSKTDVWPTIHAERTALAADLEGLRDEQWTTRTLCTEWTVRDVLAHMTATAKMTPPQFFARFVGAGFSLTKMQTRDIATEKGGSPADTLARFKAQADSSNHPPGPADTWLGEVIVHSEDIRRPLGLNHDYPTDALVELAEFYRSSNLIIGAKKRIAGLKLRATDTDWSSGDGPEVCGPILSIVLAMTGRKPALEGLTGEGVATLRSRS